MTNIVRVIEDGVPVIPDGYVTAAKLTANSVTTDKIGNGQITNAKLGDNSVDARTIAAGAVTDAKLAGSITPSKITGTAVVQSELTTTNNNLDAETTAREALEQRVGNLLPTDTATATGTTGIVPTSSTLSVDLTHQYLGKSSLGYVGTLSNSRLNFLGSSTTGQFEVEAGETYTFRAMVYNGEATSINSRYLKLWQWTAPTTSAATSPSIYPSPAAFPAGEWTQVSYSFTITDPTVKYISLGWYLAAYQLWITDIGFWKGSGGDWAEPGNVISGTHPANYSVTDYGTILSRANPVIEATGVTHTLPLSSDNRGVKFTIINSGTETVTIGRTSGDYVNGVAMSLTIPGKGQLEIISTGSSWNVLSGRYTTNSVGLATYEWNHADNKWRLVAYDTGWRDVSSLLINGWTLSPASDGKYRVRRTLNTVWLTARLDASSATGETTAMLPAGFRPGTSYFGLFAQNGSNSAATTVAGCYWSSSGAANVYNATGTATAFSWSVDADLALPSSLPGTQVTAPQ